jgi:GR25 family glycosyltransferase involved in LPS biosynthesis
MIYDIAIVISLERRKDRSERVFKHLEERGIKNIYALPAFDGAKITPNIVKITPPPRSYFSFRDEISNHPTNHLNRFQIGCTLSHVSALKFAKMLKVERALIVEDDVEFVDNISEVLDDLEKEAEGLDWEHIYLGGAIRDWANQKTAKISEHLVKPGFTDGLQAYIVQGDGFNKIANAMLSFKTTNDDSINDIMFREKNPLRAYMRVPKVAFQIKDFSELDRKVIDRQDLRQQ